MISHRNVISNTIANTVHEFGFREELKPPSQKSQHMDVSLGLLPQSHIYALVLLCHVGPYRGDQLIVLPKFELRTYLNAIQKFRIATLYLVRSLFPQETTLRVVLIYPSILHYSKFATFQVPPVVITMLNSPGECSKYDLSSVKSLYTGAAPLGSETANDLLKLYPDWKIRQAYGE
jgi:acyl-CoA synthetase (AMP-forming)/AMP-acid ligase II